MGRNRGKKSKKKNNAAPAPKTNKQKMQDAAKKRHQKFKQTRVQTFGGKKTSFSDSEKKRITDAGYSVSGYSKAAPNSGATSETAKQVAKDNAQYGNTVPAGSFNISPAGQEQAAANLAARTVPAGSFGISEQGKKVAAAQLQEKRMADKELARITAQNPDMAKYYASLPPGVRNDALIGGRTRAPGVELGIGIGTLVAGKAALGSVATGVGTKGLGYKGTQVGFTGMNKKGFDAISKGAKYIPSSKPQILGKGAYSSPSFKPVPGTSKLGATRYAGSTGSLGGGQTPGGVVQSIVPGKASRIGMIESQAKVPGATFDKGVSLAKKVSEGAFPKSQLANTFRNQMNLGVSPGGGFGTNLGPVGTGAAITAGGLNIAAAGDDSGQSNTGRTLSSRALGAVDAVLGTDLDNLGGRTTPFGESLTSSINAFNTANQNIGELTGSTNPVKNLAGSLMLGKNVIKTMI